MEHLHLILFLILMGSAIELAILGLNDWLAADRILKENPDDQRN
jgi:hypothetical protein